MLCQNGNFYYWIYAPDFRFSHFCSVLLYGVIVFSLFHLKELQLSVGSYWEYEFVLLIYDSTVDLQFIRYHYFKICSIYVLIKNNFISCFIYCFIVIVWSLCKKWRINIFFKENANISMWKRHLRKQINQQL